MSLGLFLGLFSVCSPPQLLPLNRRRCSSNRCRCRLISFPPDSDANLSAACRVRKEPHRGPRALPVPRTPPTAPELPKLAARGWDHSRPRRKGEAQDFPAACGRALDRAAPGTQRRGAQVEEVYIPGTLRGAPQTGSIPEPKRPEPGVPSTEELRKLGRFPPPAYHREKTPTRSISDRSIPDPGHSAGPSSAPPSTEDRSCVPPASSAAARRLFFLLTLCSFFFFLSPTFSSCLTSLITLAAPLFPFVFPSAREAADCSFSPAFGTPASAVATGVEEGRPPPPQPRGTPL